MKRYVVLAAAVVMQCCLGGVYAWSIFDEPLRGRFGYTAAQTALVMGTTLCVFCCSMVVTGRLQDRLGPRPLGAAAGVLLAAGYLLASAHGGSFGVLILAVGGLVGLGIACGYVCPIAAAVKWFPRHKGLVCGLAVAGYGAGAIVLSNLAGALLSRGWDVLAIFRAVGVGYGAVIVLAAGLLMAPPAAPAARRAAFRARGLLGDRRFWRIFLAMGCGSSGGLLVIGNLKPIGTSFGLGAETAVAAIGVLAVGNAAGRIVWGFLHDLLGPRRAILLSLSLIALSVLSMYVARASSATFLGAALAVGFTYGSCFALYPARVAHIYGPEVLGTVYSAVMLAHGAAALAAPWLGGKGFDLTGSFVPGLLLAGAVALAGLGGYAALSRGEQMADQLPVER